MLQALVIVLREGVESALVLAIVLSYLQKTGRAALTPWVYAGVGLALVGSVAGAITLTSMKLDSEAIEGPLMLIGALFVITLVWWMNRAAKGLKKEIEAHVEVASTRAGGAGWGVLLFATFMILREGVETVLFLAAASFTSKGLAELIGAGLGLALAVAFGYFLIKGSLRVDIGRFFRITTIVLYVLAFQLIVGGFHELAESGRVPSTKALMAFVGPIVRHDTYVFLAALVLAVGLVGLGARRGPAAAAADAQAADTAAARRLALAEARRRRLTQLGGLITALLVVGILVGGVVLQPGPPPKAQAAVVTPDAQGLIDLPLASVNDGKIHFFEVADPKAAGAMLRFFAIQKPDGAMQACMDACEICGDLGYYQDLSGLNCRNCGAPINLPTLGQTGGCNPIPVQSSVQRGEFVVDAASIYDKRILAKGKR
jgi:high-affinity iron transporter